MHHFWLSNNAPQSLYYILKNPSFANCNTSILKEILEDRLNLYKRKDLNNLNEYYENLPDLNSIQCDFKSEAITISSKESISIDQKTAIISFIKQLIPWRKGPFNLFDTLIDAEWRSNLKWQRILPHLKIIENQNVLDIGASSGYYMYRMLSLKPKWVLGIDPNVKFKYQFEFFQKYVNSNNLTYELLGIEHMVHLPEIFDTILCMGILYHRRSPLKTLKILSHSLKPGGNVFLETLIIPGEDNTLLSPFPTYAKMKNTYFLPTQNVLNEWILKCGFKNSELLSINQTSIDEQRQTKYCPAPAQSLSDFLNSKNPNLTVEGYPAPLRICLKLTKGLK